MHWAVGAGLALAVAGAHSADLGSMHVLSASGEPLRVQIEVTSIQPGEAASLKVGLASPEVYRRAEVQYAPALAGLRVALQDRVDGRKVVEVSSAAPVDAAVLDLLIQLDWSSGRFVRQYSFVLDARAVKADAPSVGGASGSRQVQAGDTLFGIANAMRPEGATVYQSLAALLRANPKAFIDGNMNLLRAGATLALPDAAQVGAVSDAEARRLFDEQAEAFTSYRQRLAGAASGAKSAGPAPSGQDAGRIEAPPPAAEPAPPAGDELKLSAGADPAASDAQAARDREAEERDATAKAEAESESRLKELQGNIDSMRGMLELPSQTLAQAGQPSEPPAPAAQPAAEPPAVAPAPDRVSPPAETSPPATLKAWLLEHSKALLLGFLAVLAAIVFAVVRRSRREEDGSTSLLQSDEPVAVEPDAPTIEPDAPKSELLKEWDAIPPFPIPDDYGRPSDDRLADDDLPPDDDEPTQKPVPAAPAAFGFDLDLDDKPAAPAPAAKDIALDTDVGAPDAAVQLQTAQAYLAMGDRDGARELFEQVLRQGDDEQRRRAREALASL